MQEVLQKPNISIKIDFEKKRLYQIWTGFIRVADFKAAIDLSVECFRQHKLEAILSDTSEQAVLAKEGSDYAVSTMPELTSLGLKKVAFVLPKSAFTQMSVENFLKKTKDGQRAYFASRAEAETWLDT